MVNTPVKTKLTPVTWRITSNGVSGAEVSEGGGTVGDGSVEGFLHDLRVEIASGKFVSAVCEVGGLGETDRLREHIEVRDTEIARLQTDLELARAQISELREQVAQLCGYDSAQEMDADR